MPTYDYRCKSCDHRWEEFQSMSAPPTKKCPECGKSKAERVIGPGAGFLFKGSGFYITDYRSDSYKKAAEAERKNGSETKSETSKSESNGAKAQAATAATTSKEKSSSKE